MPKVFTSKSQKTGELGENIAVRFLMKHGFQVIERNFTRKYGEIDIVAIKDSRIYFIEVKSVQKNLSKRHDETLDSYRAEDNMHPWKLKRFSRVIQAYLLGHPQYENNEWQIDLLVVFLDLENKKARVKVESDIIL